MELQYDDYYKSESHEDRLELLVIIYEHKPELLRETIIYEDRYKQSESITYPYIVYQDDMGKLTGSRRKRRNVLSRSEFLEKLDIQREKHKNTLKHNFI